MHVSSTRFPQALFASVLAAIFALAIGLSADERSPVVFRIFLKDGRALVSYGEFARVADRVVFSVPLGEIRDDTKLHLVSIDQSVVDWGRTDAYAAAVRARRYAETRGEDEFALLVGQVTNALNDLSAIPDPARRLVLAEEARRTLAAWPAANHGYKAGEVAHLVSLFDEAIAELRAAAGQRSFDLSLVATTAPPPVASGDVLPAPSGDAALELAFNAAMVAADPDDKLSLLRALEATTYLRPWDAWTTAFRGRVTAALEAEVKTTRAYADLTARTLKAAEARAARADVQGLQDVIARALRGDEALGRRRRGEMASLLATLDARLDEARRLRLARDAWILRTESIKAYRQRIGVPLERMTALRQWLVSIRELAGPDPKYLRPLMDRARLAQLELSGVTPPAEARSAHQLLTAAFHMARQAATLRLGAVSSNDSKVAWDASAAAAGAITLADRAVGELHRLISSQPTR